MIHTRGLRVLLPTSFSDACALTGRALSQLSDTCGIDVTIAHVARPGGATVATRRELESFLIEANGYERCRRILIRADTPATSIAELCQQNRFDLVMAPASDRSGLRRLFTPSFRARLLRGCQAPLWTVGGSLPGINFRRRIRTIACLLDFRDEGTAYLPMVTAFAARLDARVRILHVIRPVDHSTLGQGMGSTIPLTPAAAVNRLQTIFAAQPCPDVDVVVGHYGLELRRMVEHAGADLLFVGPADAAQGRWLLRHLDRLPCPVVCIDRAASSFDRWIFQPAFPHSTGIGMPVGDEHELAS